MFYCGFPELFVYLFGTPSVKNKCRLNRIANMGNKVVGVRQT